MGECIAHHDGRFLRWSTVVDAPTTFGMAREDFEAWYLARYGTEGIRDLPARLERAVALGTSFLDIDMSLEDLVCGNRAGPEECELTLADVIRFYFVERREPTAEDAIVPVSREEGDDCA